WLKLTHNSIATIYMELNLQSWRIEIRQGLGLSILEQRINLLDHAWTAYPRDADGAIPHHAGPLQLDPVVISFNESRTTNPHFPIRNLLECAVGEIQSVPWSRLIEWVFPLVQGVSCDRDERSSPVFASRLKRETGLINGAKHHVRSMRLSRECAALQAFPHVTCQ